MNFRNPRGTAVGWLLLLWLLGACHAGAGNTRQEQLAEALVAVQAQLEESALRELAAESSGGLDAESLVEALFSPDGEALYEALRRQCSPRIAVLRTVDLPWSVVLVPLKDEGVVRLEAYGASLERPWRLVQVPVVSE